MKAVFDTKPNSGYDDEITRRYHFPARRDYLDVAHAVIADWVVFREPRRNGGRQAYIGAARVLAVEADPARPDHAYAVIETSSFLPFDRPLPFLGPAGHWEQSLRAVPRRAQIGAALQGKAMRPLADEDFAALIAAGLSQTLAPDNAIRLGLTGFSDVQQAPFDDGAPPGSDQVRRVEAMLVNRKIRDASFRLQVCDAYDDRCAVTGLRIINGGGKSEVQAAHIVPVAEGGPDVVQNGIALSGTVHWLFDRHLISITDDYKLLVAHNRVPSELLPLFAEQMNRIHLPKEVGVRPHPSFLAQHRERFASAH